MSSEIVDIVQALCNGTCTNPHHFLGLHEEANQKIVRIWMPDAESITLDLFGEKKQAEKIASEGLFICSVSPETSCRDYQINGKEDPYAFTPTFSVEDGNYFNEGIHYELYNAMGADRIEHEGVWGVKFSLWAPNAVGVSLIGDFNGWDGRFHPMRAIEETGVWEIFMPRLDVEEKYKFQIQTKEGYIRIKADPMAFFSEKRPHTASLVFDVNRFEWEDDGWMQSRSRKLEEPVSVYEVHLGSWKKKEDVEFCNYRDLAHDLSDYCREMGYTHIELLPIMEHPLDESWGYQVTGFFSVTSRYGTPEDFQYFVNHMHKHHIGVFLDWVPGHFPTDDFSLNRFDGTELYEYSEMGLHPHWNTLHFDYTKPQVSNFLIASALFWLDKMHIDGLRVDAVSSLIYLDFGRNPGEWAPNKFGSNENLEAIEFLKHMNSIIHQKFPTVMMMAEESHAYPGVTHRLDKEGLGFDMKWNMGWMNDTLKYFSKEHQYRSHHHNDLTFSLVYAFSERFLLALSHDEVVHEKRSLIGKMPGNEWEQAANLRLLLSYMTCHPGKNFLFMGGDIGQYKEWNSKDQVNWDLLEKNLHRGIQQMVKDLNHFYQEREALWKYDFSEKGFDWISFSDRTNCIISYLRRGVDTQLVCVHNFMPNIHEHYFLSLPNVISCIEVFSSDDEKYGGSNKRNQKIQIVKENEKSVGLQLLLAPLATMIFEVNFADE